MICRELIELLEKNIRHPSQNPGIIRDCRWEAMRKKSRAFISHWMRPEK